MATIQGAGRAAFIEKIRIIISNKQFHKVLLVLLKEVTVLNLLYVFPKCIYHLPLTSSEQMTRTKLKRVTCDFGGIAVHHIKQKKPKVYKPATSSFLRFSFLSYSLFTKPH